jgi:hypothetical protein
VMGEHPIAVMLDLVQPLGVRPAGRARPFGGKASRVSNRVRTAIGPSSSEPR